MHACLNWFRSSADVCSQQTSPPARVPMMMFFLLLGGCLTFNEFRDWSTLPLTSSGAATVPLFNVWTIGWNADRARHGFVSYWDAPIFHPAHNTFAFSEPQPATVLVAPVIWITGSPVIAYKLWLFLSLTLNGIFAARLLRQRRYSVWLQLVGGTAVVLLPVVHQRIDVIQLVSVWGILWFWSCVCSLSERPGIATACETGIAFAVCTALCVHHTLFLILLLVPASAVFIPCLADRRFVFGAAVAAMIGGLLAAPIVIPIRDAAATNDFTRKPELVEKLSAKPVYYAASQPRSLVAFDSFKAPASRRLCVGWLRICCAAAGIACGLFIGMRRRWIFFLVLTGVFAFVFSLGPNLELSGWKPWQTICEVLPGFRQVRSVFRFAWFVQLAIVLLAVEGLWSLKLLHDRLSMTRWYRVSAPCLVVIPAVLIAAEVLPQASRRIGVPDVGRHAGWIEFVRSHTSAGQAIACLPFASGQGVSDFDVTARWMLYGLHHKADMVNGYSGFFPRAYLDLQQIVNDEFPSASVLQHFVDIGVEYLVVARSYRAPDSILAVASDSVQAELVLQDKSGIDVYHLTVGHQNKNAELP